MKKRRKMTALQRKYFGKKRRGARRARAKVRRRRASGVRPVIVKVSAPMAKRRSRRRSSGRRRSRRRSTYAARRFSSIPRARRRRGGFRRRARRYAAAAGLVPFNIKRPVPILIAAAAGGAGLWALNWGYGKLNQALVEKFPAIANTWVSRGIYAAGAVGLGWAVAKYGKQRMAGAAIAFGGLAQVGLGILQDVQTGVRGVGDGRDTRNGNLPQYMYNIDQQVGDAPERPQLPESVRIAAAA